MAEMVAITSTKMKNKITILQEMQPTSAQYQLHSLLAATIAIMGTSHV